MNGEAARQPRSKVPATGHWRPTAFPERPEVRLIGPSDVQPIMPDLDLWDCWPLQHEDGRTLVHAERQWWFFLSSRKFDDPAERHVAARIRLLSLGEDGWRDHGNALDPATSPGTREWAGSAVLRDDGKTVCLFFTAAGRRDRPFSFEQRLFCAQGPMGADAPGPFGKPEEIVSADGERYLQVTQSEGAPGTIKAFRDPAWFRDPETGERHILFTASAGWSNDPFNGIVGIATLQDGRWTLGDPLIDAIGVNNELERPCMVYRDGYYYLFWSTQKHTFSSRTAAGPNGLYAMVARSLCGPWQAVNGSGLVAANPSTEPAQTYSWWVTGEGEVWSFIDYWGMAGRKLADHPELLRRQFGGTPAPVFQLRFDGNRVTIAP